jgi:hypothetical protein
MQDLDAENIQLKQTPLASNVIWKDYFKSDTVISRIIAFFLNLLLLVLALTFVTPLYFMEAMSRAGVEEYVKELANLGREYGSAQLYDMLAPVCLIVANYVVIPMLIERFSNYMGFQLYS